MRLSENFTLAEFTASETAARRGIDNTVREAWLMDNLRRMAAVMEEIRLILGAPIIITSGYRSPALNEAIGSGPSSAHIKGLATDFIAPKFGMPYSVCRAIEPQVISLGIDQLIYEHTWVHVGLRADLPRHQVITLARSGGYVSGIVLQGDTA